jgi:hypothetical protein
MNPTEIITQRLINHQLAIQSFEKPKDLVNWMGALQAQDYNAVKWAIGMRLNNGSENHVEEAINKGEIIRIHLLRPTWHFVSAEDVYWMLELNASKIKSSMKSRHTFLGLTPDIVKKSQSTIKKMLEREEFVERDEILNKLIDSKIVENNLQVNHLLTLSEQDGIICSGPEIKNKQTYALLEKRVPWKNIITRDEAICKLTKKYFQSHGPATLQDFVWWAGINNTEAKKGIEMNRSLLLSENIEGNTYYFYSFTDNQSIDKDLSYLLPAFDEFIISYKEREMIIRDHNYSKLISSNGIFRPVILSDMKAVGTWKRIVSKGKTDIEISVFDKIKKSFIPGLKEATSSYLSFKMK